MNEKMPTNDLEQFQTEAARLLEQDIVSETSYLEMCRRAAALRTSQPELGEQIAYEMVSLGSKVPENDERIPKLKELYYDLDVPEGHVDTSDGFTVDDRWNEIVQLSAETEA